MAYANYVVPDFIKNFATVILIKVMPVPHQGSLLRGLS